MRIDPTTTSGGPPAEGRVTIVRGWFLNASFGVERLNAAVCVTIAGFAGVASESFVSSPPLLLRAKSVCPSAEIATSGIWLKKPLADGSATGFAAPCSTVGGDV